MNDLFADAVGRFSKAGLRTPRLDARVLCECANDIAQSSLLAKAQAREIFERLICRRLAREPVAYITGQKEFFSLPFEVGRGCLVPRPETETLVEEMLQEFKGQHPQSILDLGTGSGCLLVAALKSYGQAKAVGVDNAPGALVWAKRNIARHGLEQRAWVVMSDWECNQRFDVVLSNPPYIPSGEVDGLEPEILRYEPRGALDGGVDGLDAYRAILGRLGGMLNTTGRAFLELGIGQEATVAKLAVSNNLKVLRTVPDLAGIARCVVLARSV